jgi:hypothetical protein
VDQYAQYIAGVGSAYGSNVIETEARVFIGPAAGNCFTATSGQATATFNLVYHYSGYLSCSAFSWGSTASMGYTLYYDVYDVTTGSFVLASHASYTIPTPATVTCGGGLQNHSLNPGPTPLQLTISNFALTTGDSYTFFLGADLFNEVTFSQNNNVPNAPDGVSQMILSDVETQSINCPAC